MLVYFLMLELTPLQDTKAQVDSDIVYESMEPTSAAVQDGLAPTLYVRFSYGSQ